MRCGATVCAALQLMQSLSTYQAPGAFDRWRWRIASRLEAAEPHGGLAARDAARRHDEDALVIGRADFAFAVARDDRAGARDHLDAPILAVEMEIVRVDCDAMGDEHRALRQRGALAPRRRVGLAQNPGGGEESPRRFERNIRRAACPVMAALDQQRDRRRSRVAEPPIIAQLIECGHHWARG